VTSTDPGAPNPTWTKSSASVDPNSTIESISCPSDSLCVIGDSDGNVLISHNPGSVSPSWSDPVNVSADGFISKLSCHGDLCMALNGWASFGGQNGVQIVSTSNAGAAVPTWKTSLVPVENPHDTPVTDVSCPSGSLCYAATGGGDVLTTTNPDGTRPVWSAPQHAAPAWINALECTSPLLCGAITQVQALTAVSPTTPEHTISLIQSGNSPGSVISAPIGIDCPTSCAQAFDDGTPVTLTPEPLSTFQGWSGGGCSGTGTCQITVGSDVEVTATFDYSPPPPQHAVNINLSGAGSVVSSPGGINCGSVCGDLFDEGTVVTLTATPAPGWTFNGWSGAGCSGTGSCQFTVASDEDVTASFGGGFGTQFNSGRTGKRAAALAKCKKKRSARARKRCKKKAHTLPV
jgi:hypothetical protein